MPRVLMASTDSFTLASSPAGGPPAPQPQSSVSPPPSLSPSPPPPSPSPPLSPPPTPSPPPPSPPPPASSSGRGRSPPAESTPKESPPAPDPPKSPTPSSPPPPVSPPPSTPTPSSPPPSSLSPPPLNSLPPPETTTLSTNGGTLTQPSPQATTTVPASPPPSQSGNPAPATSTPSSPSDAGSPPPASSAPPAVPGAPSATPQVPAPPGQMGVLWVMPPPGMAFQSPPDPHLGPMTAPPLSPPPGSSSINVPSGVLVGVAVAGFLLSLASVFMVLFVNRRGKKRPSRDNIVVPEHVISPDVYHPSNGPGASPVEGNSYDFSGSRAWFTYDELVAITGGFSPENVIGEGGFGKVYMGTLGGGRRVAVKQLKVGSGQGEKEFRAEVEIISRMHHRHLVTLVGYCVTENHRLLVYEFVANKTLEHHLHGKGLPVMDWPKRLKIAIGSARGLTYLHEDCHPRIIHRDIKSSNILLDEAFEAKVADFGLAKLTNDSHTHISTRVMGTFGYMAPEYASSGKLTDRSDVFSFGVVLLELITSRKPVDSSQPLGEESLVEWARPLLVSALETDDYRQLADPALEGRYSNAEMRRMVEAAAASIRHAAAKRPRMVQVWRSLDVDGSSTDLTNGVKLGHSTAYDSEQYSQDIELFRRMAFANDLSTAEYGFSDEDEHQREATP